MRTTTTSATPSVSEEQIEQARARKIVSIAEDGGLKLNVARTSIGRSAVSTKRIRHPSPSIPRRTSSTATAAKRAVT